MKSLTPGEFVVQQAPAEDIPQILELYENAIAFQKQNGFIGWESIDAAFIVKDQAEGLLYEVRNDSLIVAAFCVCYSDPLIWREREKGDALYLHRVVVRSDAHGARLFEKVLRWAARHAHQKQRRYIRMDTWADNHKLIGYYHTYGFRSVEQYRTGNDPALPTQHRNLNVTLLERSLCQETETRQP